MNNKAKRELRETIASLQISDDQAKQMVDDITAGDALLNKFSSPELTTKAKQNVTDAINKQLIKQKNSIAPVAILIRIAALFLIGTMVINYVYKPQDKQTAIVNEVALTNGLQAEIELITFESAIRASEETTDDYFDEISVNGILSLWEDKNWDIELL